MDEKIMTRQANYVVCTYLKLANIICNIHPKSISDVSDTIMAAGSDGPTSGCRILPRHDGIYGTGDF